MTIDHIIVELYGDDPRILELSALLQAEPYGRAIRHRDESGVEKYYAAIQLDVLREDEEETLADAAQWVAAKSASLQQLNGEKVLEIQSHFFESDGSRSLSLDAGFVKILAQASLGLRHQVSQAIWRDAK